MTHRIVIYVPVCICDARVRLLPDRERWLRECVMSIYWSDLGGVEKVWFRDNTLAWKRSQQIIEGAMAEAYALDKLSLSVFEDKRTPGENPSPLVAATWNILQGVTDMFDSHPWATEVALIESDMVVHPEWLVQSLMLLDNIPTPVASVSCYLDSHQHSMRRFVPAMDGWTQACEARGGVHVFTREFWSGFSWSMDEKKTRVAWDKQYQDARAGTDFGVYYTGMSYAEHLGGISLVNPRGIQHRAVNLVEKGWIRKPDRKDDE